MSHSVALNDVKRDVKSQGLEDFPSKPFFLTVKKNLTPEQFAQLFKKGFPNWDKINGDDFLINNTIVTIPSGNTHEYHVEIKQMISWMETHLKGVFHVAGVYYPKKACVQFQFKEDMEKTLRRFS